MRVKPLVSALILGCWVAKAAWAQPHPPLERVQISIWPEYDRPAALVIVSAWLPGDASLPQRVALPMPTAAGMPHAVAKRDIDGTLLLAQWTRDEQGDVTFVYIETEVPEVRIEFYSDLDRDGTRRRFGFVWPGGMAVGRLQYEVMQPAGARDLTISPPAASQRLGSDGLTYLAADLGAQSAGDAFSIDLSYDKPNSELTAHTLQPDFPQQSLQPQPTEITAGEPPARFDFTWLVVVPIVFASGAIVVWLTLARKKS